MKVKEAVIENTQKEWQITLSGELDAGNADEFYSVVSQAFMKEPKNVHFICTDLQFIDSTVLGSFVKLLKRVRTEGKSMRLSSLPPKIKKLFTICALDRIMEIDV